ncbi:MAG: TonB family protein [Candidatus Aminicenantes bacterium]|nr:TonB family protein [Candidatus Aminicenantes bacterium]
MRKFIKFTCILALNILVVNTVIAQEKIIFESLLFKGIRDEAKPGAEVTISSFSEPFIVHIDPSIIEKEAKFVARLKEELKAIYQFKDAELLAKGITIWDGTKDHLNESVLLDKKSYLIRLYPEILSQDNVNLKIEVSKFTWKELTPLTKSAEFMIQGKEGLALFDGPIGMSFSGVSTDKVLSTEIVIGFNEPLVLGFPSDKDSYFLSLLITKKDLSRYVKVGGVEGGVIGGVEGGVIGGVKGGIKGGVEGDVIGGVLGGVVGGASYFSIQAIDPVCGKRVARGKILEIDEDKIRAEVSYKYEGKTYFFCSNECLEKFKKNPEKYIKKDAFKTVQTTIKPVKSAGQSDVDIIMPTPIRRIKPIYPEKCKKEKIEGTVVLEIKIDAEGNVIDAKILKSVHPDIDKAAMEAIKKWKYKPVLKDGKPVPVVFAVTINFWLRDED